MNEVEAIRTSDEIAAVTALLTKRGQHFADIWKFGINVALRISDLLDVKYEDFDLVRRELTLREGKTGKLRTIRLNNAALYIIMRRREENPNDVYLFQSKSNRARSRNKPLTRCSVARTFKQVGDQLNIKMNTHSMRKTRGYMMHQAGVSLEQIARVLNHSSPSVSMAYIGLTKEMTLKTYEDFEL